MAAVAQETLLVVARAKYCDRPGPKLEISGMATVTVRWKCSKCGCYHQARV